MRFIRFQFIRGNILSRHELFGFYSEMSLCWLLRQIYWICLNTFVLSLVLTGMDFYFNQSPSFQFEHIVKANAIVSVTGLLTMQGLFMILNNLFAWVLLAPIFSKNNYESNIKLFSFIMSPIAVYIVKNHYLSELGLVFTYPIAVIIFQVFVILSLRSGIETYGIKCS